MKVLLLFPEMPFSFFSYSQAVRHLGCKAGYSPLGLLTVAALLPREWPLRLVDLNVQQVTDQDWNWADLVMISGMVIQRRYFLALTREAKARGKMVVAGGPYPTILSEEVLEAGADFLVRGEGETTIPLLLAALSEGQTHGVIDAEAKPDLAASPLPRYDLINLNDYLAHSVQTSRGCPHDCEFCDIAELYGRRPRYKKPRQVVAELESLFRLGWRGPIFVCDDNFIGNKKRARAILRAILPWSKSRGEPFVFNTQVTVDLGLDRELIDQMTEANFVEVCVGIESQEDEALSISGKHQNLRISVEESLRQIKANGLTVMGSFILGMDGERPGAADRLISLVEAVDIPLAMINLLQPVPQTRLWQRLEKEGRLRLDRLSPETHPDSIAIRQFFIPSRSEEQIRTEYLRAWETLYEPSRYLARAYRFFLGMRPTRAALARRQGLTLPAPEAAPTRWPPRQKIIGLIYLFRICWQFSRLSSTRWLYWRQFFSILRHNPSRFKGYMSTLARSEDMFYNRDFVCRHLGGGIGLHPC